MDEEGKLPILPSIYVCLRFNFWDIPSRRTTMTAQSHNLLQDSRIFQNLVLNDSSHRAKEIGTKIVKVQKISRKLWLCAVMVTRRTEISQLVQDFPKIVET